MSTARENLEAGGTTFDLALITEEGMRVKLGSGGLPTPDEAVACWRTLFRAAGGGVDFAEMGRAATPLILDIPLWHVMRGPLKVPKKERKLAVKGVRTSAKAELEQAGEVEVLRETTAEDQQVRSA